MRYSNLLDEPIRVKYPITIDAFTGDHGVVRIDVSDVGLGMTPDIVKNFFLQIGRSWYRSSEFSRDFSFTPTSRFGIGFLSVFAVSDDVTVTTRWHEGAPDSALRMHLTGPRSYLLLEDATRSEPGTTVSVRLREPMATPDLLKFLRSCCVANEFVIIVRVHVGDKVSTFEFGPREIDFDGVVPAEGIECRLQTIASTAEGVFGKMQIGNS